MKQKGAIVKTVFDAIYDTISTTEDIHRDIVGIRYETMKNRTLDRTNNANIYETVKSVSGRVENLVLSFFK
jgi:hypothetical protein